MPLQRHCLDSVACLEQVQRRLRACPDQRANDVLETDIASWICLVVEIGRKLYLMWEVLFISNLGTVRGHSLLLAI